MYLPLEQVQNGDLNWVVPGKLLAFAGPTAVAKHFWGYRTFTPEDYHQYFVDTGVTAVVRLNNEVRVLMCDCRRCCLSTMYKLRTVAERWVNGRSLQPPDCFQL